ncbi:FG-GAP repeat protein [Burkholderia sp. 22PA0099]|uniref:FG-GAP repeat protein n=1 Tax=Burkholderia sp. 22PA0099 TaxID=3237372 RepID=UPI0039C231E6
MSRFESRPAALAALAVLLAGSLAATAAQAAPPVMSYRVDANTTATLTRIDSTHVRVRLSPGNVSQTLALDGDLGDGDGTFDYALGDYNFDGHRDVAVTVMQGMVNEAYQVYLYDPAAHRFTPLHAPSGNARQGSCGDLTNLEAKPAERTLYSSCRSGPVWYSDAYRYRADGTLYLYQSSQDLPIGLQTSIVEGAAADGGPASVRLTYDEHGKVVGSQPQAYGGGEVGIKVAVPKLPLHDSPHDGPTRRYVVQDDTLDLIGASADVAWLQVRFHNPRAGRIEGWIKSDDAIPADQK